MQLVHRKSRSPVHIGSTVKSSTGTIYSVLGLILPCKTMPMGRVYLQQENDIAVKECFPALIACEFTCNA